jgi:hypothetical protein
MADTSVVAEAVGVAVVVAEQPATNRTDAVAIAARAANFIFDMDSPVSCFFLGYNSDVSNMFRASDSKHAIDKCLGALMLRVV